MAIRNDGSLWIWGDNQWLKATTPAIDSLYPYMYGTEKDWKNISAGKYHSLAIKNDGSLWAWGNNSYGQVGDGSIVTRTAPTQVGYPYTWSYDWKSIAAGGKGFSVALKEDGSYWGWGYILTEAITPVQETVSSNWKVIAAGYNNILSININGHLFNNLGGVTVDSGFVAIAAGNIHYLAIKQDGTLWAWGDNEFGELGDSTYVNAISPIQIGNAKDWIEVSAGFEHSLGLRSDGTLWAWGYGGLLGNGTTTGSPFPIQVGTTTGWVSISAGDYHSLGLKSDGTLWAWGANGFGQLGLGTTPGTLIPVQVPCSSPVTDLKPNNMTIEPSISIFPNPTNGQFKLKGAANLSTHAKLINYLGQSFDIYSNSDQFDISYMPDGQYTIEFINENTQVKYVKFLKLR